MYAVVQTGGKQYRVSVGDVINVEKLNVEAGKKVVLDDVIAIGGEGTTTVGKPFVEGASIDCRVIENGKGKKVIIYKYKAKKDYRKKQGHRQPYTQLEVLDILTDGAQPKAEAANNAAEKKTPSLKSMKKAELIEFAKANNIEIDEKATNAEMIAAIEAGLK